MPSILIVDKVGTLKKVSAKTLAEPDFYKKAGFKTNEGFQKHTMWNLNIDETDYNICLYGKTNGRANTENKYDFPPPVDTMLFFGNCVLANIINGEIRELNEEEWGTIYEYLFGGFEDLGDDDDSSETNTEDELAETGLKLTKDGYAKDGFIVDDDEEEDEFEEDDEDVEVSSEDSIPKKKRAPAKRTATTKKSTTVPKKPKNAFVEPIIVDLDEGNDVLDCTSELSEESYM